MGRVFVGQSSLTGKLEKYASRFDLLEVRPFDTSLPRGQSLRTWRDKVPDDFAFSVMLPRSVASLAGGEESERALRTALGAAEALRARCLLLCTPPSVRPTRQNRERVAALVERLPRQETLVAWEASGIWEVDDLAEAAAALGVLPVVDPIRDPVPAGPIAYVRVRTLGSSARLGAGSIERLAERIAEREEAYVVVDGPMAHKVQTALLPALERHAAGGPTPRIFRPAPDDELDADEDDDVDDEDDDA